MNIQEIPNAESRGEGHEVAQAVDGREGEGAGGRTAADARVTAGEQSAPESASSPNPSTERSGSDACTCVDRFDLGTDSTGCLRHDATAVRPKEAWVTAPPGTLCAICKDPVESHHGNSCHAHDDNCTCPGFKPEPRTNDPLGNVPPVLEALSREVHQGTDSAMPSSLDGTYQAVIDFLWLDYPRPEQRTGEAFAKAIYELVLNEATRRLQACSEPARSEEQIRTDEREAIARMIEEGDPWEGHQAPGNAPTIDPQPLFMLRDAIVERIRDGRQPQRRERAPLDTERCEVTGCEAGSTIEAVVAWLRREEASLRGDTHRSTRFVLLELALMLERGEWRAMKTSVNTSSPPSTVSAGRVADGHDQAVAPDVGTGIPSDRVAGASSGSLVDTSLADRGPSTSAPSGDSSGRACARWPRRVWPDVKDADEVRADQWLESMTDVLPNDGVTCRTLAALIREVRALERERCAVVCEEQAKLYDIRSQAIADDTDRADGEAAEQDIDANDHFAIAVRACAHKIRETTKSPKREHSTAGRDMHRRISNQRQELRRQDGQIGYLQERLEQLRAENRKLKAALEARTAGGGA